MASDTWDVRSRKLHEDARIVAFPQLGQVNLAIHVEDTDVDFTVVSILDLQLHDDVHAGILGRHVPRKTGYRMIASTTPDVSLRVGSDYMLVGALIQIEDSGTLAVHIFGP